MRKIILIALFEFSATTAVFAARGMVPPVYCPELFESQHAIADHYEEFRRLNEDAYETYFRLSANQRKVVAEFEGKLNRLPANTSTESLRSEIGAYPGFSTEERRQLVKVLGLGESTAREAVDRYRKNYQYLFWSDHSVRHMLEVIERSRELSVTSPTAFLDYFAEILKNPEWQHYIDHAIRLHDSRMSVNRASHAELLLAWDDATFPAHWSPKAKVTASVLAMLHSKSTIPYASLSEWKRVLREELLPKMVRDGSLTEEKATVIRETIETIDSKSMALAATWVRISDAARPMGTELRNSLGQAFALSEDESRVVLLTPKGKLTVQGPQSVVNFGQLAIGNFRLVERSGGKFTIEFPYRLAGANAASVRKELEGFDFVGTILDGTTHVVVETHLFSPEAKAIAETVISIIGDFPADLLKKMNFELK